MTNLNDAESSAGVARERKQKNGMDLRVFADSERGKIRKRKRP